ncbi:DUF4249 domain-containing protein [Flavicella marina]|uniref:DUF4249 domain-containing protein n=1 Tax=Flavicella marina TaxID=1475951 RepID=UPI0012651B12|nr:DUF4249 domain-containing protein [Flavicella marina]
MKYIYIFITILLFTSCEDVIDLPLEEGPKRLVIDANINWQKGTSGANQKIRLTETAGFYDLTVPVATGATVTVTSGAGTVFPFTEEGNTGIYSTTTFLPEIEETYTLSVNYNGETFTAEETLKSVSEIVSIEQSIQPIFGTDLIKVEFFFQDPEGEENYYINQFNYPGFLIDTYGARSDEFTDGQLNSVFIQDEDLVPGQKLTLYFYGGSKTYFNYFNLLLDQIEAGGPFATPPAEVKGNGINITNPDKKPLGYFRLSEMVVEEYVIQEIE